MKCFFACKYALTSEVELDLVKSYISAESKIWILVVVWSMFKLKKIDACETKVDILSL